MSCVNFWRIINGMHRFSIDFLVYSGKNPIILATLRNPTYEERQNNHKQPLWQNGESFPFFVEGDQFWSQYRGESVAKVDPFCQGTNIILIYYFLSIMPNCKQK
jgi:hypothetical protein